MADLPFNLRRSPRDRWRCRADPKTRRWRLVAAICLALGIAMPLAGDAARAEAIWQDSERQDAAQQDSAQQQSSAKDSLRDVLPPGIARVFGTLRMRGLFKCVAFSPDGKQLVTIERETAAFWDAETGELVRRLQLPGAGEEAIALSPDGSLLACGGDHGRLVVWDLIAGAEVISLARDDTDDNISKLAFSPDGKRLATISHTRDVHIHDCINGEELASIGGNAKYSDTAVAFSPDGKRLVFSGDGQLHVHDAHTFKALHAIDTHTAEDIPSLAFISATKVVVSSTINVDLGNGSRRVGETVLWNVETGRRVRCFTAESAVGGPFDMQATPDGRTAAVWRAGGVDVFDVGTGKRRFVIPVRMNVGAYRWMAMSPDGTSLALASHGADGIQLFDIGSGNRLNGVTDGHDGRISALAVSPDGERIASTDDAGRLVIWDTETGQLAHTHDYVSSRRTELAECVWSPDSETVYVVAGRRSPDAYIYGVLYAYDARLGRTIFETETFKTVSWCAVSKDGKLLALPVGGGKQSVGTPRDAPPVPYFEIRDARSGRLLHEVTGVGYDRVGRVEFTDDDGILVSLPDWELRGGPVVWDLKANEHAALFPIGNHLHGHISADGTTAVAVDWSRFIHVIDFRSGRTVHAFKRETSEFTRDLAISPDGGRIATRAVIYRIIKATGRPYPSGRHTVEIWDTESGKLLHTVIDEWDAGLMSFSPDGTRLYGAGKGMVFEFDLGD